MPRRTVSPPSVSDTFLRRICKALDEPPRMLALNIKVDYSELALLLSDRHRLAEIDRDEVWWKIYEYAGERQGEIMAVRAELSAALQRDRRKRAARIAAQRKNMRKKLPDEARDTSDQNKNI